MRQFHIFIAFTILFLHFSCKENSTTPIPEEPTPVSFTEVRMECTDLVSMGGTLNAVIKSRPEFDSLIYQLFQKPLDEYWNLHYESILNSQKQRYPGLSDSEYVLLVRRVFYSVLPFRGTDSCRNPYIDFNHYTLLGHDVHAGGCRIPDYQITLLQDDQKKEIIYKIKIVQYGYCSMLIPRNKWILIPKISDSYRVVFQKEYTRATEK